MILQEPLRHNDPNQLPQILNTHSLVLNIDKTNYVIFNTKIPITDPILIRNKRVTTFKYLDNKLTRKPHIKTIT